MCTVENCEKPVYVKKWGYCQVHYARWKRHGHTDPTRTHPPTGMYGYERALWRATRQDNGCLLVDGPLTSQGYALVTVGHKDRDYVHRVSWEHHYGPIPDDLTVDHLCHTLSDCHDGWECKHRRCMEPTHLELVTLEENQSRGRRRKDARTK